MNRRGSILVVEDDEVTRDGLLFLLQDRGYAAQGVANGKEALDYLRSQPLPCLIVLDLMMPVMNGAEFRRRQREEPALASLPVVVLSAVEGTLGADMEAAAYVPKPVDPGELLAAVEALC